MPKIRAFPLGLRAEGGRALEAEVEAPPAQSLLQNHVQKPPCLGSLCLPAMQQKRLILVLSMVLQGQSVLGYGLEMPGVGWTGIAGVIITSLM